MTNNRLEWQSLLPAVAPYQAIFDSAAQLAPVTFAALQPRLDNALTLFCHPRSQPRFMLLKAQENREYLALIANAVTQRQPQQPACPGSHYTVHNGQVQVEPASQGDEPFAAAGACIYQEWVEPEQLFGCVRQLQGNVSLAPGLIHRANGGVLILSARTLLAQPLMWLRLKQMIEQRQFLWYSPDETRPLPVTIPPMPLELRLIVVGDRLGLADFHEMEPEISELAMYGEYEEELQLADDEDMTLWCSHVNTLAAERQLPALAADVWPPLLTQAVRYSGDCASLPLSPTWLGQQLSEASLYAEEGLITAKALDAALTTRQWREGYLAERMQDDIELGQILIQTEGEVVGQINGLSVLDYPGHPGSFGEPSRISCVVHLGDGEFTDVERKAELGGNLHAKGMMIMQAFLISELELDQQLPFSASMVFEQSYGEVDGDSATLAELCVLISALSQQPINQQIAVTGSVDQFGNVQPIGGVNEKIEGFFEVCQRRGLTGQQGVILPAANVRHLCLRQDVVDAVREGQFHLWAVDSVAETLPLLTGCLYTDEQQPNLLSAIQERIAQVNPQERQRPWCLRWLNWFNHG
ncbi:TPA: Lon protease family protein [Serratia rubidaea]|uniref:Lon protease family protein n=1 Tax=Serratia rubidaea TaxID=61652 RepID=UPI0023AFBD8F|nr:Lon protease family protein [Serratia rubidaea]MDK1704518.1 Lon protease family protein [Serratia rubidaea]HDJ1437820.1 Lon protease family protein [Serratia rubidaea]HDJ1450890.1 Lon protease family protein [Serratia rubidaea]HDJ1461700.1 Lon protease family protein [Serratia rubidaea]HDJ2773263.1 Lon protease family protein [Serratia rubidaea]